MSLQVGDIAQITGGQKYLRGLEVQILKVNPVNLQVQLLKPELGRRFGRGSFNAPPSLLKFVRKGDGTIPQQQVDQQNGDGDEDFDRSTGFRLHDFKVGDKVRTAEWTRPTYIADQPGKVKSVRRTRILVEFDNPPIGTRFARGVVMKPERLYKVA